MRLPPHPEDQFPEIFVFGYQEASLTVCQRKYLFVGNAGIKLGNVDYVVPGRAERGYDLLIYIFIGQKFHAA